MQTASDIKAGTVVIEWAPFELAEGRDEAGLLAASEALQRDFLGGMPGFLRRDLLHMEGSNNWVDLVYWQDLEAAKSAAKSIAESPVCALYFSFMKLPEGAEHDVEAGVSHYRLVAGYAPGVTLEAGGNA